MIKIVVGTASNYTMGSRVNEEINNKRFQIMEEKGFKFDDGNLLFEEYKNAKNIVGGVWQTNMMLKHKHNNIYVLSRNKNLNLNNDKLIIIDDYKKLVDKYKNSKETLVVVGGKIVFDLFTPYANEIFVMEPKFDLPGELIYDSYENKNIFKLIKIIEQENVFFKTYKKM